MKKILAMIAIATVVAACGTYKATQTKEKTQVMPDLSGIKKDIDYIRRVSDNAVYSKNIVSPIDLGISAMGRDINVSGKIQMRKDQMIRIMITPFGLMEVGRIEFTPTYVLVVDRMNKEYVKAKYSDLDFLKVNGMDFYTLQSLFWNKLFMPAKKTMAESDLANFTVGKGDDKECTVVLKHGSLTFNWATSVPHAQITGTDIIYRQGTPQESGVTFRYEDFVPLGMKTFPSRQVLSFNSGKDTAKRLSLDIRMTRVTEDSKWEVETRLSDRYREVPAREVLEKLV